MSNSTTTTPRPTGPGALKRIGAAIRARAAAEQAAAKVRFTASLPSAIPAPSPALSVAPAVPQPPAPVPSAPATLAAASSIAPPATPPAAASDGPDILARYKQMTGVEGIRFFLENEREILAARAGVVLDSGKFAHLSGRDRLLASTRIAQP